MTDKDSVMSARKAPLPLGMERMHPLTWLNTNPHDIPIDEIVPGFPVASVGAMIAPGGIGKSYLALELAVAVVCPTVDIAGLRPQGHGLVAYINAEDGHLQLAKRLAFLGQRMSPKARDAVDVSLCVAQATGRLINLGKKPLSVNFNHESREEPDNNLICVSDVEALVKEFEGYRLIIIDTLTRFHALDENNNGQMSQLVSTLEFLAERTRAAVLFLHHMSKASIKDGHGDSQTAARGASALVDNVRYAAHLTIMTEAEANKYGISPGNCGRYLRFGVVKQNYGPPQEDHWLERKEGGVLVPANLPAAKLKPQLHSKQGKPRELEI